MPVTDYPKMFDSTAELDDPAWLRSRMEDDGCVYFRGLVDPDRALGVKHEIMALLRDRCIIKNNGAAGSSPLPTLP